MKTQHTPGPWVYAFGAIYQGDNADTVEEHAGRIALADRDNPHTSPTERDANCRLIALAPEMVEALRKLLAEFESRTALIETCDMPEDELAAMDNARGLLAKLEGREG